MRVLITTASRHGSTAEIATAIARRLRARSADVDVATPTAVATLDRFDAVIIGSAVYAGTWMKEARAFLDTFADALAHRQVWIFSSGPLGDEGEGIADERIEELTRASGALGHHVFAGRLDRGELNVAERLLARMVHAPDGDFRDWDDVDRWADSIADTLGEPSAS